MNFLSAAQEQAYHSALKRKYKAVALDVDGTLTPLARWIIPHSLRETLLDLPLKLPLALATGRPFDYIKPKLAHLCESAKDPESEYKRWTILTENGGAGYTYHPHKKDFEAFFEVPWPDSLITKDALEAFIKDKFGWHVQVLIRTYSLVVRYPNWFYLFPRITRLLSRRTAASLRHLFQKMQLDGSFVAQDSGIGNLIIPKESGKGKAVGRWAERLGISLKDVLVIGDQAQAGENDEEFLSGHFGAAFTVGHQTPHTYPLPVLDEKGRKLWGPEGTEALLKKLFHLTF